MPTPEATSRCMRIASEPDTPGVAALICAVLFMVICMLSRPVQAALSPDIANGSMTGTPAPNSAAPGWEIAANTPDVVAVEGPFNNTGVDWTPSPDGGTFARLIGHVPPEDREEIQQVVGGFVPGETYTINFQVTNLGFYYDPFNDGGEFSDWRRRPGFIELLLDGASIGTTAVIDAPLTYQAPIQWYPASITFTASAVTHTLKISPRTSDPAGQTAYMAVDGVNFGAEICDNGVDDDSDGLIDAADEDCQDPPSGDEVCNNGIDDDGDGLIDNADPDCSVPDGFQDIKVRCIHQPLYPQAGESVTLRAAAINGEGEQINVEFIEIYEGAIDSPDAVAAGLPEVTYTFTPTGEQFHYGCRIANEWEIATSWRVSEEVLRTVEVGDRERPDIQAIPVAISGYRSNRIDMVFFADGVEYSSPSDPAFQADVYDLIYEGFFTIPWFVQHQWLFNFWIGDATTARSGPNPDDVDEFGNLRCFKTKPDNYDEDYSWADVAALVHTSNCRDGASGGAFSIEMEAARLQVVAHEAGHTPFGMSDEYPAKPSGYYQAGNKPNVFSTEQECRDSAVDRTYEPDDCRLLATDNDGDNWYLPEPDYRSEADRLLRVKDLMQQTGAAELPGGNVVDRYKVGNSEKDRMGWFWTRCVGGDC